MCAKVDVFWPSCYDFYSSIFTLLVGHKLWPKFVSSLDVFPLADFTSGMMLSPNVMSSLV
jgi:hypothetical protein